MAHENWNNSAFESDDESDDDESSSKKKKKAEELAKLLAKKEEEAKAKAKSEDDRSLWEKLSGSDSKETKETEDKAAKEEGDQDELGNEEGSEGEVSGTDTSAAEVSDTEVKAETNQEDDAEVPLEDLSDNEKADAIESYVDARVAELSETPPDEEPEAAAARAADLALLIALNERMKQDNSMERPLVDKINEAYADTSGGFAPSPAPGEFVPTGQDMPQEFLDDEPIALASSNQGAGTSGRAARQQSSSGISPAAPAVGGAIAASATNMVPKAEAMYYEQKAQARGLLVGAVVGYLIGRRRGRIKTEKRLKTVERKLQKKVTEAQELVAAKEREIQNLAVANYRRTGEVPEIPPIVPVPESDPAIEPAQDASNDKMPVAKSNTAPEANTKRAGNTERIVARPDRRQESVFARFELNDEEAMKMSPAEIFAVPVPVPIEGPQNQSRPEQLRQWRSESQPLPHRPNEAERPADLPETPVKPEATPAAIPATQDDIEKMNGQELLDYSARIPMGESSLRRVYDAKLVNEEGLRRLIIAHESGQDMRRALAREFLAKELKFEHDPRLHGRPLDDGSHLTGGGRARGDNRYAAAAAAAVGASQEGTRTSSAGRSSNQQNSGTQIQHRGISPLLLVGLTILTILLAIYAIWLTVTR